MQKLSREALWSLEQYAVERPAFRARVREHKKTRRIPVGSNLTLYFEDALTIRYQVQEMLRAERIFEPDGIEEELHAYNPLIPDGRNWKCTLMIEYTDVEERRAALSRMKGIEDRVWVRAEGHEPVFAIADEDLDRSSEEKTSSVHFLRFELDAGSVRALREGAPLSIGVEHPAYTEQVSPVPQNVRAALLADLD